MIKLSNDQSAKWTNCHMIKVSNDQSVFFLCFILTESMNDHFRRDSNDSFNPSYGLMDSKSQAEEIERPSKKIHEYEAIWLSGAEPCTSSASTSSASTSSASTEQNQDNTSGKDSLFVQKSNEIRLLLNELRNTPAPDEWRTTPSPIE